MNTTASPAESRDLIIERLVGDTGEPSKVQASARRLAERSALAIAQCLEETVPGTLFLEVVEVKLGRMADAKAGKNNQAMAIAATKSSPDGLVMTLDPQAVAILVNILFGGDPDQPVAPIDRDLSAIEMDVVTMAFQDVARAMNSQGSEEGLGVKLPVPDAITGQVMKKHVFRDGAAVKIILSLATAASRGTLTLTLPQRLLIEDRRGKAEAERHAPPPSEWRSRFSEGVMRSSVHLEATMALGRMTLGELAALKVGQVIDMSADAHTNATIAARGKTLFICEFGKLGQNYTVRVRHPYDAQEDTIEGIIAG